MTLGAVNTPQTYQQTLIATQKIQQELYSSFEREHHDK